MAMDNFLEEVATKRNRGAETVMYVLANIMMVVFGLVFEMPIVMIALTSVGLVNPIKLRRQRKYAILIIFILAAVLTPPDVTTQVLLGLPMIALFEVSSLVSGVIFRRKLKTEEAEQREAEAACAAA